MSAETPGSPAPGPAPEPDPDPGHLVSSKLFAMPAAMVPLTAAVGPDTGKPYVKNFVRPVTRPPFKVGPLARAEPASTALTPTVLAATKNCKVPRAAADCSRPAAKEFGARPPAKPNFVIAGCSLLARPPAKPNYAGCDPLLSLHTTAYLLPLPSIMLYEITSRSLPIGAVSREFPRTTTCSLLLLSLFLLARPPANPIYANYPPLSLHTADYLLPLPSIQPLVPLDAITSRKLKIRCCVALMDV